MTVDENYNRNNPYNRRIREYDVNDYNAPLGDGTVVLDPDAVDGYLSNTSYLGRVGIVEPKSQKD